MEKRSMTCPSDLHFLYDKTYLVRPTAAPVSPTMPLTEMRSRGQVIDLFEINHLSLISRF